jgi:iron complex outermembrane recepter protein
MLLLKKLFHLVAYLRLIGADGVHLKIASLVHAVSIYQLIKFSNAGSAPGGPYIDQAKLFRIILNGYDPVFISLGSRTVRRTKHVEVFREKYNWSTWSNQATGEMLSDNDELRSYENLFVQMETNLREKLFLSTGLNRNLTRFRYTDHYTEDGDQSGNRSYPPVFSPRFGTNYRSSGSFTFFGNVSHGFSTPSFEETLLPEGEINPGIKPESGWNMEAGLRAGLQNRLRATISYYRIYIKNLLVARRTGEDAYVGVNAGKSIHPGLEAEMKWVVFNPGVYPSLILDGNITWANYRFQHFTDGDSDFSGNLLPGTARSTWLLAGNIHPVKNMAIRIWHRHTGKMPVNDVNSDYTDSYGLTSMEVTFASSTGKIRFNMKAGIQNLFDVRHAAMLAVNAPAFGNASPRYYYPGNPRNYFLSVQMGWK